MGELRCVLHGHTGGEDTRSLRQDLLDSFVTLQDATDACIYAGLLVQDVILSDGVCACRG